MRRGGPSGPRKKGNNLPNLPRVADRIWEEPTAGYGGSEVVFPISKLALVGVCFVACEFQAVAQRVIAVLRQHLYHSLIDRRVACRSLERHRRGRRYHEVVQVSGRE